MASIAYSKEPYGTYLVYRLDDEKRSILIQSDWDYPDLASTFGWSPCPCGRTDGTVDCPHLTASKMISQAAEWLDENEGQIVDDPGYFTDHD